jgi:hypothetical protein
LIRRPKRPCKQSKIKNNDRQYKQTGQKAVDIGEDVLLKDKVKAIFEELKEPISSPGQSPRLKKIWSEAWIDQGMRQPARCVFRMFKPMAWGITSYGLWKFQAADKLRVDLRRAWT